MNAPPRLVRASVENSHRRPEQTARELEREERILAGAQTAMAELSRGAITFTSMALALRMVRSTLRRHFTDLDELLAAILHRHLRRLAEILGGAAAYDDPDRPQKMRAAYLAHTRTVLGGYTEAHLLLVRDRHLLPADLLTNIEAIRHDLGDILAYGHAGLVLDLLDNRYLDPARLEATLAAATAAESAQPEAQAANPTPPPPPAAPAPPAKTAPPKTPPPWLQLAFEPPPADPTNDLYRYGRGWHPKPNPHPPNPARNP